MTIPSVDWERGVTVRIPMQVPMIGDVITLDVANPDRVETWQMPAPLPPEPVSTVSMIGDVIGRRSVVVRPRRCRQRRRARSDRRRTGVTRSGDDPPQGRHNVNHPPWGRGVVDRPYASLTLNQKGHLPCPHPLTERDLCRVRA